MAFKHNYLISSVPTTGQAVFYPQQSSNIDEFPCNWRKDIFAEGCLDAPEYLPGAAIYVGKFSNGIRHIQSVFISRDEYFKR